MFEHGHNIKLEDGCTRLAGVCKSPPIIIVAFNWLADNRIFSVHLLGKYAHLYLPTLYRVSVRKVLDLPRVNVLERFLQAWFREVF